MKGYVYLILPLLVFISCSDPSSSNGDHSKTGTVSDIDGNVYQTVKIGDQWWMAENLKVTKYRNGEAIQKITDNSEWIILEKCLPKS